MDVVLYDDTLESMDLNTPFVQKQMIWQNSVEQSYNNYITFNLSQLNAPSQYVDWKNGYLEIPYTVSVKASADVTTANAVNSFMLGLKNGTHQIINSINVSYNSIKVVEQTDYINQFVSYKLVTETNSNDVNKLCGTIAFCPDNGLNAIYSATGNARSGQGISNNLQNVDDQIDTVWANNAAVNTGFFKRCMANTSYYVGMTSLAAITTAAQLQESGTNYFSNDGGAGAARIYTWNLLATIRLRDLCDFFEKVPLISGALLNIVINYNSCDFVLRYNIAAGSFNTLTVQSYTQTSGNSNPILYSSGAVDEPNDELITRLIAIGNGNYDITVSTGINRNSLVNTNTLLNTARIYLPTYKLSSQAEARLIEVAPERRIVFNDLRLYSFTVGATSNFSQLISGGIANIQSLVIVPQYNKVGIANFPVNTWQSPFCSAPGTTANYGMITNFNVLVGGKAVLAESSFYGFQQFLDEVYNTGSTLGNQYKGHEVGLIDKNQWESGYRYMVVDLSRRPRSGDSASLSLQINGKNNTAYEMTLFCYFVFKRDMTISPTNGNIITTPVQ